jgi:preprotein translocase subunit SecD
VQAVGRVLEPEPGQIAVLWQGLAGVLEPGQPEPWRAEQTACAWDTIAFRLDRERTEHLDTKRPSVFFSGSAAKEYDAKTASLTSQLDNVRRATETLKAELQAKLAAQAQQAAQRDPQRHAAAKERHEGLMLLHKAVGDAGREIDAERAHGHDRENDNDFGL